ncbi:MAG TPA: MAC/perforin domain-containing protein [Bacteroidales bacterium]|nr:MAC/perforin domain-containing protein [Bacteroidales bacterium]
MKKLYFFPSVLCLLFVVACEKDNSGPDPKDDIALKDSIYNNFQNLGAGYDVFDNYADVVKVKGQILDLVKLSNDQYLEKKTIEKGTFHTVEGKTVNEYLHNFSTKTNLSGSYGFFSGSLSVNYESSQYSNFTNSFATVQSLINKYLLQVKKEYSADDLKNYLTEKFVADINNPALSSTDIFSTYGTHCLRSIIVGGRLDFNVSANESYISSDQTIGVHARASFKSLFTTVNIENTTVDETSQKEFESHMEKSLEVYGGSSQYGQNIINEGNYDAWIESIATNHVFCEYGDDPFIPIWELCDNAARKSELQDDYENWSANRQYKSNVDKIEITFAFADSSFARIRGDANPATGVSVVMVESQITLRLNDSKNVDLVLFYDLYELGGDNTHYKGEHVIKDIYKGTTYNILGIVGDTTCFCGETLWSKTTDWTDFKGTCSFVDAFQFKADDLAGMDNKAGVKGKVRFEAWVAEKNKSLF